MKNIVYLIIGTFFGIVLMKSEVVSWFRIQEMFRFQSIHMFGIIGLAIFTGIVSLQLIKLFNIKSINGDPITLHPKSLHKGVFIGGLTFGLGWALTGACPGPLFALSGAGYSVYILSIIAAIAGTWLYGFLREKLPH